VHAYRGQVLVQDAGSARAVDMPFAASALDSPSAALSPPALADALQQLTAGVVG